MRRSKRPIVGLCLAIVAVSACVLGLSALEYVLFEPAWVLLPDDTPLARCTPPATASEQPAALRTLLPPRAPPVLFAS